MLIEGAISIAIAIAAGFVLPNWGELFSLAVRYHADVIANNTPWLSEEETEMAQYRLVLSAGGYDENDGDLGLIAGAKLAMKDWVSASPFSPS